LEFFNLINHFSAFYIWYEGGRTTSAPLDEENNVLNQILRLTIIDC